MVKIFHRSNRSRPFHLGQLIRQHLALPAEPRVSYCKRHPHHREHREVLLAVDFHLQVNLARIGVSRLCLEHQRVVVLLLLHHRCAQPSQRIAQVVDGLLDGFSLYLYQVYVLRIAGLRSQIQLAQRGTATESQVLFQERIAIDAHQRTADDQVLLDELILHPRGLFAPLCYISYEYHNSSISIISFTMIFHFALRSQASLFFPVFSGTYCSTAPELFNSPFTCSAASFSSNTSSRI